MRWMAALLAVAALAGCIDGPQDLDPGPTGRIDGAVLNHVLIPYANATVVMRDTGQQTQTSQLGGFSFFDVPVGFHTIEVVLAEGSDRQVVAVEEDKVTKMILQVFPPPTLGSYITALSKNNVVDLAMPGEPCGDCAWRASLRERHPDLVELIVAWDGRHPAVPAEETHLIVELRDQDGRMLAGPLGRDDVLRDDEGLRLCAAVDGARLPAGGALQVSFRFDPENQLPHPDFAFESFLRLHYADMELAC